MLVISSPDVPATLKRGMEAFQCGDALGVSSIFDTRATLSAQIDPKLARRLGIADPRQPVVANNAVDILHLYAMEFEKFEVTYFEVISAMRVGRDVAAVCEWAVRFKTTGDEVLNRCNNIWTFDQTGRKIVAARSVCKVLTPGAWMVPMN